MNDYSLLPPLFLAGILLLEKVGFLGLAGGSTLLLWSLHQFADNKVFVIRNLHLGALAVQLDRTLNALGHVVCLSDQDVIPEPVVTRLGLVLHGHPSDPRHKSLTVPFGDPSDGAALLRVVGEGGQGAIGNGVWIPRSSVGLAAIFGVGITGGLNAERPARLGVLLEEVAAIFLLFGFLIAVYSNANDFRWFFVRLYENCDTKTSLWE